MFDLGNERATLDWACKQTYIALFKHATAPRIGVDSRPIDRGFKSRSWR